MYVFFSRCNGYIIVRCVSSILGVFRAMHSIVNNGNVSGIRIVEGNPMNEAENMNASRNGLSVGVSRMYNGNCTVVSC